MSSLKHIRARWPGSMTPPGEPEWLLYELDEAMEAVIRTAEIFPDGSIARNSVDIEQRTGKPCPSLIDLPLADAFDGVEFEPVASEEFERVWAAGTDRPMWTRT